MVKKIVLVALLSAIASTATANELSKRQQSKFATECYESAHHVGGYKDWAEDTQQTYFYYPFIITNLSSNGADIKGTIRIDFKTSNNNGGWSSTTYNEYSRHYECGWSKLEKGEYRIADALVEYYEKGSDGELYGKYYLNDNIFTPEDESNELRWVNFEDTKEGGDWEELQYRVIKRHFLKEYKVNEPKAYWEWK